MDTSKRSVKGATEEPTKPVMTEQLMRKHITHIFTAADSRRHKVHGSVVVDTTPISRCSKREILGSSNNLESRGILQAIKQAIGNIFNRGN